MMTTKDLDRLAGLNLDSLPRAAPKTLFDKPVGAVLIALGSNYQAKRHLIEVREKLALLGTMRLSKPFQNPDFTATAAQPKPDYVNQCVYLCLNQAMTLGYIQQIFKSFESSCGRNRLKEPQQVIKKVTMDIDILLVHLQLSSKEDLNSPSGWTVSKWTVMADRYPFKAHEILGVEELASK